MLRNFWANHRKRLGLDQVLQEAGFEGRRRPRRAAEPGRESLHAGAGSAQS